MKLGTILMDRILRIYSQFFFMGIFVTDGVHIYILQVVETVVKTQSNNAAVVKQDVAQASSAASQSIISPTDMGMFGNVGVSAVDTAAAASSQTSASSSATSAKAEKVQKKTKKTTTTVVKSGGSNSAAIGGATGGEVQHIQQVIEETIHKAASTSAAASSEVAAAASSSSAASSNSIAASGNIATSAATATNASSSASSAETNSTLIKKITKKTTIITKSKATDTGHAAVINSEIPKAVLSNIEAKPVAAKKPPTAILSGNNEKKAAIDSKAVFIATVKPKLVAPIISSNTTSVPTESTTAPTSTEEPEIEAEEVVTTVKASATG